ncbi:phosphotransferase [Chengkuizengella sp. SCS-71B]|uniref:phosphotransferase n=1 Tax=Chengkuizengella sp. SCS-71B TaxID=3115290 RepID=UPI0032C214E7
MQTPKLELWYMLMEYCEGYPMSPDSIKEDHMYSLGKTCAMMHKQFKEISTEEERFHFENRREVLFKHYQTQLENVEKLNQNQYIVLIKKLEAIIESLDDQFFKQIRKGFTHSDFASDNVLFTNNDVIVLDFDRNCYSFQWHDVGRAIMSYAFNNDSIDISLLNSFVKGYNFIYSLSISEIVKAIKLVWIVEVTW